MRRLLVAAFLLLVSPHSGDADWPQWRGPARDGVASGATLPERLAPQLEEIWSLEVGAGHASPVVAGDRVYLHSRVGDEEVVRALSLADGSELWRWGAETPYSRHPAALSHGKGPRSTPLVADGRLCTFGVTGRAACFDAADGRLLWQHDFEGRFDRAWPDFGVAMSTGLFDGGLVLHAGGKKSGALLALDPATGEELWAWSADPPAYASPILAVLDGVPQIVTQSRTRVVAVDPGSGRELWSTPFETAYEQNSVTPLWFDDRVIISGLDNGVAAYEPHRDAAGRWVLQVAWKNDEVPMYMSSPVVRGNLLFGMSDKRKGQLFCIDLATGDTLWKTEGREGENAALIVAGDRLIVQTDDARLAVGPAVETGWSPEATYTVADSPTWAHPALVGDRLLVKDRERLTVYRFLLAD